jgi:hypothetical protein
MRRWFAGCWDAADTRVLKCFSGELSRRRLGEGRAEETTVKRRGWRRQRLRGLTMATGRLVEVPGTGRRQRRGRGLLMAKEVAVRAR